MLTLYDCTTAPSPRRTRMLLAEKKIEHKTTQVDLRAGEHLSDAYQKLNPECTVPTLLLEDGETLTNNAAIAQYLEARFPEIPMLGRSPLEKGIIAQWGFRVEMEGVVAVSNALRNRAKGMKNRALTGKHNVAQIAELSERGIKQIKWFFETLDEQLSNNDYVAGDSYSIVDITTTVVVDFAGWVKVTPRSEQSALLEWYERMKARPSYSV